MKFNELISVACNSFEFMGCRTALKRLAVDLLHVFHLLCSKSYTTAQHGDFVRHMASMGQRWVGVFGDSPPIALHIMAVHWKDWLLIVKAHSTRTEGGELLNEIHQVGWWNATCQWSPMFRQISVDILKFSTDEVELWLKDSVLYADCAEAVSGLTGRQLRALSAGDLMSRCPDTELAWKLHKLLTEVRDGCDTLLEVDIGPWWVVEKKLNGGWPQL